VRNLLLFIIFLINTYSSYAQQVEIKFSHDSKISKQPIDLKITGNYSSIYYTTDGSIPSRKNKKFDSVLVINSNKALLFKAYFKALNKDTIIARSFIFDTISKLPIISITIPNEDLWDSSKGIYTRGNNAFFADSTGHWENCNFQKKWEKEVQFIYLDSTQSEVLNQSCGLRIFGESTRRQPDKSLKIVARKKYGEKRFHYPFFNQKPNITEYKQLVIRTSGNDYNNTRFKDVLNAYLVRNLGLDYMAYQQVRMYINGEYWGLYNLREKINKHYLYYNHGANKDSSSIIMGRWVTQHGNRAKYKEMYDWFFKLDTMDSISYVKAQEYLDTRNYINYRVFQIFINNLDSRGNIRYWNSTDLDSKFRMILYDTDLSYSGVDKDYLAKCLSPTQTNWYNNTWSTIYLRKLMEYSAFKNDFINQYAHLMNTALHTDTIIAAVNRFEEIYKDELPRSKSEIASHLRNVPIPMEKWLKKVASFRFFAKKRPQIAREEITRTLSNDGTYYLKIKGENGTVKINSNYGIKLPFDGIYYKNIPLPLSVIPDSGYTFKGWGNASLNTDTILISTIDTLILIPKFELIPKEIKKDRVINKTSIKNTNKSDDKILWLIAWVFIALGGILLIIYFKLRVK